jgi:hypothetical protein
MSEYAGAPIVVDSVAEAWENVAPSTTVTNLNPTSTCHFLVL